LTGNRGSAPGDRGLGPGNRGSEPGKRGSVPGNLGSAPDNQSPVPGNRGSSPASTRRIARPLGIRLETVFEIQNLAGAV